MTLAQARRLLEKDLNVDQGFLDSYKEFVKKLINKVIFRAYVSFGTPLYVRAWSSSLIWTLLLCARVALYSWLICKVLLHLKLIAISDEYQIT